MNHSKINVRYAKALFSLGKENNQIMSLHEDMCKIYALCGQSDDFMQLLDNPIITTSEKKEIFQGIFHSCISEIALDFLLLIAENNREMEIPGICRNFIDLVRTDQGIMPATVTTAEKLSGEILAQIRQNLEKDTGKKIELTDKVNPLLIGGMILRISDQQYDGSIATQLKKIKSAMLSK